MRVVQAAPAAVHQGLHLRAILPRRRPPQIRHRPQGLRGQQRLQDAPGARMQCMHVIDVVRAHDASVRAAN